jgi:choline dehydrogenase
VYVLAELAAVLGKVSYLVRDGRAALRVKPGRGDRDPSTNANPRLATTSTTTTTKNMNPRHNRRGRPRQCHPRQVGGLKFLRRLFAAPTLAPHIIEENLPGPSVQTDDELLDYARQNGSTVYHASCSCMMGNHPMSVVDDELNVHGLDGLRVIDASVMPAVTSTNTNAPTIMIAEKGPAIIKGAARQRMAA